MIRVLIVDDNHLFREALSRILRDIPGITVVASLSRGEEAVEQVEILKPDVILMDVNLPGIGGVEATHQVLQRYPQAHVLILTISEQEGDLFAAIRSGAHGYLLKSSNSKELIEAIRIVHDGEAIISPGMAIKLLHEFAAIPPATHSGAARVALEELSDRERKVLQLVAAGLSNKEIGARLILSHHTVKAYLRTILDKLHLHSRAEAAAWAALHGLKRQDL